MLRSVLLLLAALFWLASSAMAQVLFDPDTGLDGWTERSAKGKTDFSITEEGLRATTNDSASIVERTVELDMQRSPQISWQWRVDERHESADIRIKGKDDMAAALIFVFGKPSLINRPKTLIYVWANDAVEQGDFIDSPRTDKIKYVVLRAGETPLGDWMSETRNIAADFETAFGEPAPRYARRLCFFTDGDQTGERATAYYGPVSATYSDGGS